MKSRLFVFLYAALCMWIVCNRADDWKGTIICWDKCGYYIYLPALFIYHDLTYMDWYPAIAEKYHPTADKTWHSFTKQPSGKQLNKYSLGVACFQLPFFLAADVYNTTYHAETRDGFTLPYQWAIAICGIFWCVTGLFFLRSFLLRFFSDGVVLLTLMCVALGTNLYSYTAFDAGMSHPYSFMLFAAMLFFTERWYRLNNISDVCLLGVVMGFIFAVRPINIIVFLVPLLWMVGSRQDIENRVKTLILFRWHLLAWASCFLLVALVQLTYWKIVTGHWLVYSYGVERFSFSHPRLGPGLFSFRKGWFVYTPLAVLALLGFYFLWLKNKRAVPVLLAYIAIAIYATFSWQCWWYGGGFGARALIESFAVLAFPLAALIEYMSKTRVQFRLAGLILVSALIALNMFQTYQYSLRIIHWDKMTRSKYIHSFWKTKFDPDDEKYLMTDQQVWAEDDRSYSGGN